MIRCFLVRFPLVATSDNTILNRRMPFVSTPGWLRLVCFVFHYFALLITVTEGSNWCSEIKVGLLSLTCKPCESIIGTRESQPLDCLTHDTAAADLLMCVARVIGSRRRQHGTPESEPPDKTVPQRMSRRIKESAMLQLSLTHFQDLLNARSPWKNRTW